MPKGTDEKFVAKLNQIFDENNATKSVYFTRQRRNPLDFTVRHFAGTVIFVLPPFIICVACVYLNSRLYMQLYQHTSQSSQFNRNSFLSAGDVTYHARDFLEKNKDVLAEGLLDQMNLSSIPMLVTVPEPEPAGEFCVCFIIT